VSSKEGGGSSPLSRTTSETPHDLRKRPGQRAGALSFSGPLFGFHDTVMTQDAQRLRSRPVDRLCDELRGGLVILLEDVGVDRQRDGHAGMSESLRHDLG
jgi:hypothetical protein